MLINVLLLSFGCLSSEQILLFLFVFFPHRPLLRSVNIEISTALLLSVYHVLVSAPSAKAKAASSNTGKDCADMGEHVYVCVCVCVYLCVVCCVCVCVCVCVYS